MIKASFPKSHFFHYNNLVYDKDSYKQERKKKFFFKEAVVGVPFVDSS